MVVPEPVAVPEPAPVVEPVAPVAAVVQPAPVAPPAIDLPWEEPTPAAAAPVAAEPTVAEPFVEAPIAEVAVTSEPLPEPVVEVSVVEAVADDDDEPPLGDDDYYIAEGETDAYLDALDSMGIDAPPAAEPEPLPAAKPATGLAADWLELFPRLGITGLTGSIAANCSLVAMDGDTWTLHLDPAQSALFNATQQRRLNDALDAYHKRPIKLEIELRKPEQETPAQAASRKRADRQRSAEASIHDDPLVQQMIQQFAAVIRDGTIEPVEAPVAS